ncbi:MAG: hypothetical protein PWP09_1829, partial [Thermotogota bacterium]|nr:hypothetical protein [Thermotogota bacterium]
KKERKDALCIDMKSHYTILSSASADYNLNDGICVE